ncbi:hypothetical protein E4K72_01625 [Oxalobacteraceae bacterium OM1]|nr:hypothetical protein E4K72_01625 [Oxalobacteraceae bacterium OM1]
MDIMNDIMWRSLLLFLWGGAVVAVLTGIGLLLVPRRLARANHFLTRWIDTYQLTTELDRPRWLERYVYRHHRLAGTSLFAGSGYVVYVFLIAPSRQKLGLLAHYDTLGVLDASVAFLVIVGVLGAALGLIMALKPSILKELEAALNQWISIPQLLSKFKQIYFPITNSNVVLRVIAAACLVGGGSYVVIRLGMVLFAGDWRF